MENLNIFDAAGNVRTGWSGTIKLNEDAISSLGDKTARSANALNAIPSPFSRLHVFETAFKLKNKDKHNLLSSNFSELISDCLDALEMSFNAKYHESQGDKLTFIKWTEADLEAIPMEHEGQRSLSRTLRLYLSQDFGNARREINMIKYKDMIIAGTSPFTLLFTSPNLDKLDGDFRSPYYEANFDLINPSTKKKYFKKLVSFADRTPAFKAYIAGLFEKNTSLRSTAKPLWAYLKEQGIERLPATARGKLTPLQCMNGGQFLSGEVPLMSNANEGAIDIFNDHIVKVNYKIDNNRFHTPEFLNDVPERKFDFLLPVKEDFLKSVELQKISLLFTYEVVGTSVIRVTYTGNLAVTTKSKDYVALPTDKEGTIVELETHLKLNFTIGIFPFLRVLNNAGEPHADYNDFYKVLLALDAPQTTAAGHPFKTSDFTMRFYNVNDNGLELISSDGAQYKATRFERRKFEKPDVMASIYYELQKTSFDFTVVSFPAVSKLSSVQGIIIPKWVEKKVGHKKFTYSVDFGTTNTFIAMTDDEERKTTPQPFSISPSDLQMVMLQKPVVASGGQSTTAGFRNSNLLSINNSVINHEFVPPVLMPAEDDSPYKMPFRTAVFQLQNTMDFVLFNDINVDFTYQRSVIDSNTGMYQELVPNIKWDITDTKGAKRVKAFIHEICLLLYYKTLLNDGDPATTELCWFIPQSLSYNATSEYKKIWLAEARLALHSKAAPRLVSEAEAPYYFLRRKAAITDPTCVLSLDIGGGSTDAMFFAADEPALGTSFNFAGNVLWSNGYNLLSNDARENGFYQYLRAPMDEKIKQLNDATLNQNNQYFNKRSTDEIINFWLTNDAQLKVTEELKKTRFKLVYLVHFSSIIYHLLQFLKEHKQTGNKTLSAPTCIIFSGNGSKYIDFIGDEDLLSKICGYFIRKVFDPGAANPLIILPDENRKEATCFGGIFKSKDIAFTTKSHLGAKADYPQFKDIKTYTQVEADLNNIKDSVTNNVLDFFTTLKGLNAEVPFRSHLGIEADMDGLFHFVKSNLKGFFDLGYTNRKDKVDLKEDVTDSLFFYPMIGIIHDVARMEKRNLEAFIPQIHMYTALPSSEDVFSANDMKEQQGLNDNYKIAISPSAPNEATFELIDNEHVANKAYTSFDVMIKPVCICNQFPQEGKKIEHLTTINKGRLKRDGDQWLVTEKLIMEFN